MSRTVVRVYITTEPRRRSRSRSPVRQTRRRSRTRSRSPRRQRRRRSRTRSRSPPHRQARRRSRSRSVSPCSRVFSRCHPVPRGQYSCGSSHTRDDQKHRLEDHLEKEINNLHSGLVPVTERVRFCLTHHLSEHVRTIIRRRKKRNSKYRNRKNRSPAENKLAFQKHKRQIVYWRELQSRLQALIKPQ